MRQDPCCLPALNPPIHASPASPRRLQRELVHQPGSFHSKIQKPPPALITPYRPYRSHSVPLLSAPPRINPAMQSHPPAKVCRKDTPSKTRQPHQPIYPLRLSAASSLMLHAFALHASCSMLKLVSCYTNLPPIAFDSASQTQPRTSYLIPTHKPF